MSAQGQFVAFASRARIVQGPANLASRQVFLRDMSTGASTLLSIARDGGGGDGSSDWPSISADGTRIVFESKATNLVRGDTNGFSDIFMYDTTSGVTTLISHAPNGNPANLASYSPAISADGTHVAFTSSATNLGPDNGYFDSVYIYDIASGGAQLVTHAPDGSPTNYYGGYNPQISADGNLVAYYSPTADLVADDTNSHDDVFLYNAATDTNQLISRTPDGGLANGNSYGVDISADGTHVAYNSYANNLVPNDDTDNITDVFVYDVASESTTLISRATDGGPGNADSYYPSISGDGTLIAYTSYASDLVRNDANAGTDIFVHNTTTGTTRLISKAPDGSAATGNSDRADVSIDGTHIGYESDANNIVTPDTDTG
ncbi:MAG: calcium-binding protein, partial [Candidatus Nanopelagicales bacterium]